MAGTAGFDVTLSLAGTTIAVAQDVDLDASASEVDTTTRGDAGWKTFIQGLKEWSLTGDALYVSSEDDITTIISAYINGTELAATVDDFSGTVIITGIKNPQPLDGALQLSFTAKGTGALTHSAAS